MPTEVTLTSGRVLRKVEVVRWEEKRVVLRYAGGADPIAFTLFKSPTPAEVETLRVAASMAPEPKPAAPVSQAKRIAGQVFVATRGAGTYKFSSAPLAAYPLEQLKAAGASIAGRLPLMYRRMNPDEQEAAVARAWEEAVQKLQPIATTSTDADGNFELSWASGEPVFLFCHTSRLRGRRSDGSEIVEHNVWALPAEGPRVILSQANSWQQPE